MAGQTNQIAAGLLIQVSTLTGIRGVSSTPVDSVTETPFFYVGGPKLVSIGGSWEQRMFSFPLHLVITRDADEGRDQQIINDWLDLCLNAFRTGITLGVAGVVSAEIRSGDTENFASYAGSNYQAILFDCLVTVMGPAAYTP